MTTATTMRGQTIHTATGSEVAYRHERFLAEADARRLRAQLAGPGRTGHGTGYRRATLAMAAATGLLLVSGAWASLLGAASSTVPAPAPVMAPAATPAAAPAAATTAAPAAAATTAAPADAPVQAEGGGSGRAVAQ